MKITVKPRIHISLISMHEGAFRMNGGVGFSIDEPKGVLSFTESNSFRLIDNRSSILGPSEHAQLLSVLRNAQELLDLKKALKIEIDGDLLTHYGMGSGTAIRLACLEALLAINDQEISRDELVALSGRGGTSGIGIHSYFSGQLIFDMGIKNRGNSFEPSSMINSPSPPLLLDAIDFPDWIIGLCIARSLQPKTRVEEIDFFGRACPISPEGSFEALYHCLFGIFAAVKTADLSTFASAVKKIQGCEWKRLERAEYPTGLCEVEKLLYESGAICVGMSSLGPLLYFLAPPERHAEIESVMAAHDCELLFTKASNTGRELLR